MSEQPTIRRDQYNNRGDMGLKATIESLGLLLDLRKGPKLIEAEVVGEFTAALWATTIEALYMIYESDAKKENRLVQSSVAADLRTPNLPQAHPAGRRDLPEGVCQVGQRPDHAEKSWNASERRQAFARSGSAGSVT